MPRLRVFLLDDPVPYEVADVSPDTTLQQILAATPFHGKWKDDLHIFVNEGGTSMPWLDRSLTDYNNTYVERGYIEASLYIKHKARVLNDGRFEW
jgi:hypothetical protein